MPRCKDCGAEISFVQTKGGRWMPCDRGYVLYVRHGGYETVVTDTGDVVRGCSVQNMNYPHPTDGAARIPHFVTCPAAIARREAERKVRLQEAIAAEKAETDARRAARTVKKKPEKANDGAQLSFGG